MLHESMVLVRRARQITPPEALEIAASVAAAGRRVCDEAPELRTIRSLLEQTWSGQAKERFLRDSERFPTDTEALAGLIEGDHARRIAAITVTIWEAVLVPLSQAWE